MKATAKKMNVEQLRNFWNALPDCASFNHFFYSPLGDVEDAARSVEKAEQLLASAKQHHKEALEALSRRVEGAASAEWSAEQIAKAKGEARS